MFRLALALGEENPDAMLARMPLPMLYRWMAYYKAEPFGEERADLRAGVIASTIANANRGKGQRAYKPSEFMPKFGKKQGKTAKQMWETLMAFSNAQNASVAAKEKSSGKSDSQSSCEPDGEDEDVPQEDAGREIVDQQVR